MYVYYMYYIIYIIYIYIIFHILHYIYIYIIHNTYLYIHIYIYVFLHNTYKQADRQTIIKVKYFHRYGTWNPVCVCVHIKIIT